MQINLSSIPNHTYENPIKKSTNNHVFAFQNKLEWMKKEPNAYEAIFFILPTRLQSMCFACMHSLCLYGRINRSLLWRHSHPDLELQHFSYICILVKFVWQIHLKCANSCCWLLKIIVEVENLTFSFFFQRGYENFSRLFTLFFHTVCVWQMFVFNFTMLSSTL